MNYQLFIFKILLDLSGLQDVGAGALHLVSRGKPYIPKIRETFWHPGVNHDRKGEFTTLNLMARKPVKRKFVDSAGRNFLPEKGGVFLKNSW